MLIKNYLIYEGETQKKDKQSCILNPIRIGW